MEIERKIGEDITVKIQLTPSEVREAHYEYEHICDVEDVLDVLKDMTYEGDLSEEMYEKVYGCERQSLLDDIAKLKRKKIDKYDQPWREATVDAIKEVLLQREGD